MYILLLFFFFPQYEHCCDIIPEIFKSNNETIQ